jgi:very-short-patch-repair endonuclease
MAKQFDAVMAECDSPIERLLAAELLIQLFQPFPGLPKAVVPGVSSARYSLYGLDGDGAEAWVLLQAQVGSYRVDFLYYRPKCDGGMVVEVDGHDFHEKTKEQAARDKARERELTKLGWPVLRFTGAEVYADPNRCALEPFDVLMARRSGVSA